MSYFHHLYIPLPSLLNNSKRIWMRWLARVRKSVEGHGTNIIFSVFKSKLSYKEMYPGTFPPSPLNKLRFSLYLNCSMRYYTALWEWQTFLCIYTVPGPMLEARDSSRRVEKHLFLGNSEESWIPALLLIFPVLACGFTVPLSQILWWTWEYVLPGTTLNSTVFFNIQMVLQIRWREHISLTG